VSIPQSRQRVTNHTLIIAQQSLGFFYALLCHNSVAVRIGACYTLYIISDQQEHPLTNSVFSTITILNKEYRLIFSKKRDTSGIESPVLLIDGKPTVEIPHIYGQPLPAGITAAEMAITTYVQTNGAIVYMANVMVRKDIPRICIEKLNPNNFDIKMCVETTIPRLIIETKEGVASWARFAVFDTFLIKPFIKSLSDTRKRQLKRNHPELSAMYY
jgi:hypothetical protein